MSAVTDPIALSEPVKREGGEDIAEVRLVEPRAGQLRGVKLTELVQMDTDAVLTVLPRITKPHLSQVECDGLHPRDVFRLGQEVVLFFGRSRADAAPSEPVSPTT